VIQAFYKGEMMLTKTTPQSWHAHTPIPQTRIVDPIELDDELKSLPLFGAPPRGVMAGYERVSVNAPMAIAQRPFHPKNVRKNIIKTKGQIDWNLFGVATAVRNKKTGETCIINGQHRISLIKTLDPSIKDVPAHIIEEDDEVYVAKLFGYMNGGASDAVTREERLWADIVAQDPQALNIERILVKCGLGCGIVNELDSKGNRNIQVNVAGFEKCIAIGEDETIRALALIRKAYPQEKKNIDQQLLGLTTFLGIREYDKIMDPTTKLSQRFDEWFINVVPQSLSFDKGLKFFANRNWAPSWEDAIAYGIAKKFRFWLGVRGFPQIGMTTLNDLKRRHSKKFEDEDEE
jgi:hypothetical protein